MGLDDEKTRWHGLETWPLLPSQESDSIAGENGGSPNQLRRSSRLSRPLAPELSSEGPSSRHG